MCPPSWVWGEGGGARRGTTTAGSPHAEQPELMVEFRGASAQGAILPRRWACFYPTRIFSIWSGSHPPLRHAEIAASLGRYNGLSLPPEFQQARGTTRTASSSRVGRLAAATIVTEGPRNHPYPKSEAGVLRRQGGLRAEHMHPDSRCSPVRDTRPEGSQWHGTQLAALDEPPKGMSKHRATTE
jgi:hypothetical protein